MDIKIRYALIASAGLIVGFVGGREYARYQIASAFAEIASPFSAASRVATFPDANTRSPALDAIEITDAKLIESNKIIGPELSLSLKNGAETTISAVRVKASVTSKGREVPWASADDVYVNIPGGLAHGEAGTATGGFGSSLGSLHRALADHEDAALSISVVAADGPNGERIAK